MAYLHGARESYRKYAVESVLQYDRICDGGSTALFFTALDTDGHVAGGMRVEGRYESADQAYAVQEWAGRETAMQVHREISERIPAGVIEMKAGWVRADAWRRRELTAGLARIFIHSMNLMGVRYALGTVATHAVKRWQTTGGVVSANVLPVAYPDDRYRTVLMWWDRKTFADLAVVEQLPASIDESAQLAASAQPGRSRGAGGALSLARDQRRVRSLDDRAAAGTPTWWSLQAWALWWRTWVASTPTGFRLVIPSSYGTRSSGSS